MGSSTSDAQPDSSRDQSPSRGRNRSSSSRGSGNATDGNHGTHLVLNRPYAMDERTPTIAERQLSDISPSRSNDDSVKEPAVPVASTTTSPPPPVRCINPASEVNARLDTQVEVKVYPCNNSQSSSGKKKFTTFTVKPEVRLSFVTFHYPRCLFVLIVF